MYGTAEAAPLQVLKPLTSSFFRQLLACKINTVLPSSQVERRILSELRVVKPTQCL
jgi:hypothetical protein